MEPRRETDEVRRRLALAGFAVVTLLGVVALASRGHRFVGGSSQGRHLSNGFTDYLVSLGLAFGVIAIVAVGLVTRWGRVQRRDMGAGRRHDWARRLFPWLFLVGVIVFLTVGGHRLHVFGAQQRSRTAPVPTQTAVGANKPHTAAVRQQEHRVRWLPIALILGAALTAVAGVGVSRLRANSGEAEETPLAEALTGLLDDTLDDLRAERDPRRAVIAAYARMERTLAYYGVPRRTSEAPLEYLARVLRELRASSHSVKRLTDLFERAKFSHHDIDAPMKNAAIDAVVSLRAELAAESS